MKKTLLSIVMAASSYYTHAQNVFPSSGNVGIGTLSPGTNLHIQNMTENEDIDLLKLKVSYDEISKRRGIAWEDISNNVTGRIDTRYDGNVTKMVLGSLYYHGYTSNDILTLTGQGNVGVGTTNPTYKLQVAGGTTGISNTTTDWLVGATGSIINISNGANTGNTYGMINVLKSGGGAWDNLILQSGGGNVGIGTTTPTDKLAVNGKIRAQEIKVETANWPDYVFTKDYQLPSLQQTEQHIKEKGHLPGIPSAAEVKANGVDLGEMNAKLLQKIEELTLHLIEKEKAISDQNKRIEKLEAFNKKFARHIK